MNENFIVVSKRNREKVIRDSYHSNWNKFIGGRNKNIFCFIFKIQKFEELEQKRYNDYIAGGNIHANMKRSIKIKRKESIQFSTIETIEIPWSILYFGGTLWYGIAHNL